jgi:hypothetical protein
VRRILAGLAAALSITLVPVTVSAQAARAGDPNYHKPVVGECRDYDYATLMSPTDSSPAVDCAEAHTAKILATPMLPKGVTWENGSDVQFFRTMLKTCLPALRQTLGGANDQTRYLSSYTLGWFFPTRAERNQGARWLRCDVIIMTTKSLVDLPTDTVPFLSTPPYPDDVARCLTAKYAGTSCAAKHAWRATGSFRMPGKNYPSKAKLSRVLKNRCPDLTTTRAWAYSIRDKEFWRAGDHSVACFSKRSN